MYWNSGIKSSNTTSTEQYLAPEEDMAIAEASWHDVSETEEPQLEADNNIWTWKDFLGNFFIVKNSVQN